ncbi:MAG: hypothetical protein KC731_20395, partial [Myxococcales bacterium]|nr:hypothetical protein [Myxococcales bacterium]
MPEDNQSQSIDPKLKKAIDAAVEKPGDDTAWDALEDLADKLQTPDPVFDAYRDVLAKGLSRDQAPPFADRAVKFCQAWYIDTPTAMPELLGQIVERYPEIDWAFERLVVLLTSSASWDELLALYDRMLSTTRDEAKRRKLLEDASGLAKDFADQPDRAADYLLQLLRFEPDNDKLVSNLERLLERRERYDELLTLWRERIPTLSSEDARATRARIATISLEKLNQPDRAVEELGDIVEDHPDSPEACRQLEAILAREDAAVTTRRKALSLLRMTYELLERPEDVVRVLEAALAFVADADARALRRECGTRLSILGRDEDAIAHYAALLAEAPTDADARRQLRQLSKRAGKRELQVEALLAAAEGASEEAEKVSLWLEAADVRRIALEDVDGAIALYRRVLDSQGADDAEALRGAHQLNELLASADRGEERLPVLERLSDLERSPSFRRQILGEAARLAESLDDSERALASWNLVLTDAPHDLEALDATIALLRARREWPALVSTLEQRQQAPVSRAQKRDDLVTIARLKADQLDDLPGAIETWLSVRSEFGEDREVLAALDELLTKEKDFKQLAELLDGAVTRERRDTSARLVRLATVLVDELGRHEAALPLMEQALELDPHDEDAHLAAATLLEIPECAERVSDALWRAYAKSERSEDQLDLLDRRVASIADPAKKAEALAEGARLLENHAASPAKALAALVKALPLSPNRRDLRSEIVRLASTTENWFEAAAAFKQAAAALDDDGPSAAELRRQEARILEDHLEDYAGAHEAFEAAGRFQPDDIVSLVNAARCAARAGMWQGAAQSIVTATVALARVDHPLMTAFGAAADELDAWTEACAALAAAIDEGKGRMAPEVASKLYGYVAEWHRDHTGDAEAAKVSAQAAIELTPDDVAALQRLVTLQRSAPGPELADTLLRVFYATSRPDLCSRCYLEMDAKARRDTAVIDLLWKALG